MYNIKPFEKGVNSVLKVTWKIALETPLCVRSGRKFSWSATDREKSRNQNIEFKWRQGKKEGGHEIADLNFDIEIENNRVNPVYHIPASSIRGSLRSWTLQHLVEKEKWRWAMFDFSEEQSDENPLISLDEVKRVLESGRGGFPYLCDLFGMSLNTKDAVDDYSHAGRIQIETLPFNQQQVHPDIDGTMRAAGNEYGPNNALRHITNRGPLCRITQSAAEGGLHTFLEFSTGNIFTAVLKILNPYPEDIGMIALWERELASGMLRFGAITSIGRGRVKLLNNSVYEFFALPQSIELSKFPKLISIASHNDVLSDIWNFYKIDWSPETKTAYLKSLQNALKIMEN